MTNRNQIASFIAHKWRVRGVHFQGNCSNGSRDTVEKARFSSSEVPFLFLLMEMDLAKFVAHAWVVRDKNLQENPSKGSRGTADKAKCS
jgi:hypothetical protein